MAYYNECHICGALLDPGEKCNFEENKNIHYYANKYLGRNASDTEIEDAIPIAQEKLRRIISREQDADGVRLRTEYLAMLVSECIMQKEITEYLYQRYNEYLETNKEVNISCYIK